MKKANQIFREKQYEQHHHRTHVETHANHQPSYLETLSKFSTSTMGDAKGSKSYLDTLSGPKKTTWDDYKHQLERVKQVQHEEVDGTFPFRNKENYVVND